MLNYWAIATHFYKLYITIYNKLKIISIKIKIFKKLLFFQGNFQKYLDLKSYYGIII